MTIAFDAAVESVRTATTDPWTWTNTPVGVPRAIVVAAVHGVTATSHVIAVTYGGVAMTKIVDGKDTATEPGTADLWFLGASIPTGNQTVSADLDSATGDDIEFVSMSFTAAADCEVVDFDEVNENVADPSVTLQYGGRTCIAVAALYGGGAAPTSFTPNANCQTVHDHDLGAFYAEVIRQSTPGTADFAIGGTSGSDDVGFAALAVSEVVGTTIIEADGAAVGAATVASVAAAIWNGVTAAAGLAASAVAGAALWLSLAAAPGVATVDAASATVLEGIGAASGSAGSSVTSVTVLPGVASSAGTGTASAEGADGASGGQGLASGVATASVVGAAIAESLASATSTATVSAGAATVTPTEGAVAATAAASGVGGAVHQTVGGAAGVGAASAAPEILAVATGSSAGVAAAAAEGADDAAGGVVEAVGAAAGVATVVGDTSSVPFQLNVGAAAVTVRNDRSGPY